MLKKRIAGLLLLKQNIIVQSINYKKYLPIGSAHIAAEFLNNWGIDEIILLDIDATAEKRKPNYNLLKKTSEYCFVPLTVGGGINSIDQIREVLKAGADKVSINTASVLNSSIIEEASAIFGNQCIVVSIDVGKNKRGKYEIFLESGKKPTGLDPIPFCQKMERLGAGELLINSIERDGSKLGYDTNLMKKVVSNVSIPVIACGGAGHPKHLKNLFEIVDVSAAAVGNYFHFTEHSPIITKAYLTKVKKIRLETHSKYDGFNYTNEGRIAKMDDDYLNKTKFEFHKKEVI